MKIIELHGFCPKMPYLQVVAFDLNIYNFMLQDIDVAFICMILIYVSVHGHLQMFNV